MDPIAIASNVRLPYRLPQKVLTYKVALNLVDALPVLSDAIYAWLRSDHIVMRHWNRGCSI